MGDRPAPENERVMDGYGRELFLDFVPPSAREHAGNVPLMSGALVATHGAALEGPVVEVEDLSQAALTGVLRAARHADAIVAVASSAAARRRAPDAPRAIMDAALGAARAAHFDRPLVLVARAVEGSVERLSEGLYRDLEAGFTSFAFFASSVAGDADAMAALCAPLLENGLGIEVELASKEAFDPALALASLDDVLSRHGLHLAAVRGSAPGDELGGALLVCVDEAAAVSVTVPRRVVVTETLNAAIAKLSRTSTDDERIEVCAFETAEELLARIGAAGTANRLLDALARDR